MAYQDDRQLHFKLLVLCILFLVSATSFPDIPECGEVKIAKKTKEGYICVCNIEENHFTISDGRTCSFRSGGCPLGEELQDDGECRACQRGTFKNVSGAGLCQKQTDCEMLGLEKVSYGNSSEDAKCGSTRKTTLIKDSTHATGKPVTNATHVDDGSINLIISRGMSGLETVSYRDSSTDVTYSSTLETTLLKDISHATEQSTIEPAVSATGGSDTHNDDGSRGVIIIVLSIAVVVLVGIVIVCACVLIKRHIWTRMWKNMRRNNSLNALHGGDHESTRTGVMDGGLTTHEEEPLTEVVVFEASPQSASLQSSHRKYSEWIDGQKDCLLKNQYYFVQHMDNVKKVCDYLLSSCVLTPNLVAEIMTKKTCEERGRKLHTLIWTRPSRDFDKYYDALKNSGNKELAQRLQRFITSNLPTGQDAIER